MAPVTNRPRYELEQVVRALNGQLPPEQVFGPETELADARRRRETPDLLRELVGAWQSSGPRLDNFALTHKDLWADITVYWEEGRQLNPLRLVPSPGGGAGLFMNCRPERDPQKEALRIFIELLLNPDCSRLAGPCARCGRYYVRGRQRNKVYCSRSCGTRSTALAATRKRRSEEHAHKLLRASRLAERWRNGRTKRDWKKWISSKAPDITPKFLTRAVNCGSLTAPTRDATNEK